MVLAAVLMLAAAIGPLFIAATRPSHEWLFSLMGFPVLALAFAGVAVLLLYVIGFLTYCANKGYSKWLGVFLLLGHAFGLIVLLLLPDLKQMMRQQNQTPVNHEASSAAGSLS